MRRALLSVVCLFLSLLTAAAQTKQKSALPEKTQQSFEMGLTAAKQQEWLLAIRYFSEAQKVARFDPRILFNLGLAESKLPGRELRAIAWFRAYLAASPNAPNGKQVEGEVANLEIKLEALINRFVELAKKSAMQVGELDRVNALEEVIAAQAYSGDANGARSTANLFAGYSDVDGKQKWYDESQWRIAGNQAWAGGAAEAKATADSIRTPGYRAAAYGEIAQAQAAWGDIHGAQSTVSQISQDEVPIRAEALIGVAHAQYRAGKRDDAYRLLVEASQMIVPWLRELRRNGSEQSIKWRTFEAVKTLYEIGSCQCSASDIQGARNTLALLSDLDSGSSKTGLQSVIGSTEKMLSIISTPAGGAQVPVTKTNEPMRSQIAAWEKFLDEFLSGQLYVAPDDYVISISGEPKPMGMVEKLTEAVLDMSKMLRMAKRLDVALKSGIYSGNLADVRVPGVGFSTCLGDNWASETPNIKSAP